MAKVKYVYALDPTIKRRVVHVVIKGVAYSLATGHKFQYSKEKKNANSHKMAS